MGICGCNVGDVDGMPKMFEEIKVNLFMPGN
jgi:hypothetical protein